MYYHLSWWDDRGGGVEWDLRLCESEGESPTDLLTRACRIKEEIERLGCCVSIERMESN